MQTLSYILAAALIVLQYFDVKTTNKALELGGSEANKLVVWVMRYLGKWWWLSKVITVGCAVVLAYGNAWFVLAPLVLLYGYVVQRNSDVISVLGGDEL